MLMMTHIWCWCWWRWQGGAAHPLLAWRGGVHWWGCYRRIQGANIVIIVIITIIINIINLIIKDDNLDDLSPWNLMSTWRERQSSTGRFRVKKARGSLFNHLTQNYDDDDDYKNDNVSGESEYNLQSQQFLWHFFSECAWKGSFSSPNHTILQSQQSRTIIIVHIHHHVACQWSGSRLTSRRACATWMVASKLVSATMLRIRILSFSMSRCDNRHHYHHHHHHGYPANCHQSHSHLVGICHNDEGWEYDTVKFPPYTYTKADSERFQQKIPCTGYDELKPFLRHNALMQWWMNSLVNMPRRLLFQNQFTWSS